MACKTTVVNSFKRMIIYKIIRFSDWVMATQFSRYMWIIRRGVGADTRGGSPGLLRKGRKWRRIRFVCRSFLQDAIIHRKWRTTEARYPSVPLLLIKITLEITRNFYIIFNLWSFYHRIGNAIFILLDTLSYILIQRLKKINIVITCK